MKKSSSRETSNVHQCKTFFDALSVRDMCFLFLSSVTVLFFFFSFSVDHAEMGLISSRPPHLCDENDVQFACASAWDVPTYQDIEACGCGHFGPRNRRWQAFVSRPSHDTLVVCVHTVLCGWSKRLLVIDRAHTHYLITANRLADQTVCE